ncbi:hypothetical protein [Sphingomonas soli]|uniref:hypothetical protein n=1 Tax=Sphingomonas soli TaxID=266127 RepID=UPI0008356A37|nr:hypothetical protein [Sphingomonas soli]
MTMLCAIAGHSAGTTHHQNQGLDFAICHRCGCDLIRAEGEDWTEVPKGFRIVWREFGRADDAASVAARMQRMVPPARRRDPRNARPKPRRDPRGKPFKGATSMIGMLAGLRTLIEGEEKADTQAMEPNGQYVICLPYAGNR